MKAQNNELKGMTTELLGYFQKAKAAVRASKPLPPPADKELSSVSPVISPAMVASGSSDAPPPPANPDPEDATVALDNLFAD